MKKIILASAVLLAACQSNDAPATQEAQKNSHIPVANCQSIPSGLSTAEMAVRCFDLNGSNLNAIYQHALLKNPNIEGKIVFKISVGESGEVVNLEVTESTIPAGQLINNLQAYVGLMRFSKALANQAFPYTINFYSH